MDEIQLVLPNESYKEQILSYKEEFLANGDSMDGTAGLIHFDQVSDWLVALKDNSHPETVQKGFVPASTYLGIRTTDHKVVGMIDIRHELNDHLFNFGGHIGYSVRKSERCKGYATKMLALALKECKRLHINKVLITCDKENLASSKTILRQGGVLENEVIEEGRITQRYWIQL